MCDANLTLVQHNRMLYIIYVVYFLHAGIVADQFPRPIIINSATDGKTTANLRHYLRGQTSQSASNFSTTQPPTLSTSACHFGALQSTPAYDFDDDEDYSEVYEETDLPVDRTRMQDGQ